MKRFLATTLIAGAGFLSSLGICVDASAQSGAAASADAEPCVEDICVGEALRDLGPRPWQPVLDPTNGKPLTQSRVSDGYVDNLMQVLRGEPDAIKALAPYWVLRRIDSEGLRQLEKVTAVCQPIGVSGRLRAQYTSPTGERTQVSFEPVPSADGRSQNFIVATITRFFDEGMGPEQIRQLGQDIGRRYAGFGTYPRSDKPGVRWTPFAQEGPTLKLFAPIGDVFRRGADLRRHPACAY